MLDMMPSQRVVTNSLDEDRSVVSYTKPSQEEEINFGSGDVVEFVDEDVGGAPGITSGQVGEGNGIVKTTGSRIPLTSRGVDLVALRLRFV